MLNNTILISCLSIAVCMGCTSQQAVESELMDVGVARIDITPEGPIRLSGFAAREKQETDSVLSRLSAKAIAFGSDAQQPTLLITVDLLGIQWRVTRIVVQELSSKLGVKPEQITILATHTHGGPEIGNFINHLQCRGDYPTKFHFSDSLLELDQLIHIARFNESLIEKLQQVALAAMDDRKPARVAWGQGRASFAENRRTDGGPVDQSLPVLRVTDPDGSLRAILVNYACHGISLGADVNKFHGDWMGEAQQVIEARHPGVVALVAIGCAGDAHPAMRDKLAYMQAYGKEISDGVDSVIASDLTALNAPPTGKMKWVKLPFAKVPTVADLIEFTSDTTIKGYYARRALERVQRGEELAAELNYPIQAWNFDNKLVMVNLGGEVVVDYANALKQRYGPERIWINAYANDVSCYIPSRRIINEGGYEGESSMYWYNMPGPFDESIEEQVIGTVQELMPASFN